MEFKVKTPSQFFDGKRAGIFFRNGEATFQDEGLVKVFESMGYEVIKPKPVKKAAPKKKRDE